uniref:Uncharacterized protein n=1 Tax=Crocodylus porosus TaxID=8502 RepID=A0A7M4F309_CROPO
MLGNVSKRSLHLHFLKTLEHRTDVSVTSTPWLDIRKNFLTRRVVIHGQVTRRGGGISILGDF